MGLTAVLSLLVADGPAKGIPAAGAGEPVAGQPNAGELWAIGQSVDRSVAGALVEHAQQSEAQVSRSAVRPPTVAAQRATKAAALPVSRQSLRSGVTVNVPPSDPRVIAASMLVSFGWSSDQFSCLDQLWVSESDWNPYAENSTSGAYGIPQALPPEKMASAGRDWRTNPATQIEWGLEYIRLSYGTPCGAWSFKLGNSWY